ncbi:hypothetical protein AXG93_723s1200 [Marchantia polymorpha subsp. ruderalis]|uniref:Uncharacterized protein n=1 Tax=Marchantia polymorpha subsp. ruderalis TaxID=1480154 RepID=A0A176VBI8_MARPO|nr:hypothetical protein AXG93_723s1200 [Marchantia polymorpha subsp. ruderalis]
MEVRDAGTKNEWSLEWGPLDVPMNGLLEEGEEREDETETEPSGQCLCPSKQPPAPSAEDLQPSGKTKAKVAAAAKVAETVASLTSKCATVTATLMKRDEQLQMKELECAELQRKLAAEEYLHTKKELECKALRIDITNAQKLTVEICKKLKLSRKRF